MKGVFRAISAGKGDSALAATASTSTPSNPKARNKPSTSAFVTVSPKARPTCVGSITRMFRPSSAAASATPAAVKPVLPTSTHRVSKKGAGSTAKPAEDKAEAVTQASPWMRAAIFFSPSGPW